MNYRCPQCQSPKIMPVSQAGGARPEVPKSLLTLVPSILLLLLLVSISLAYLVMDKPMSLLLQLATIFCFVLCLLSGLMFWKALPRFKLSVQNFMRQQKHWKCRECEHDWHNG